jgi:hypothetical protein
MTKSPTRKQTTAGAPRFSSIHRNISQHFIHTYTHIHTHMYICMYVLGAGGARCVEEAAERRSAASAPKHRRCSIHRNILPLLQAAAGRRCCTASAAYTAMFFNISRPLQANTRDMHQFKKVCEPPTVWPHRTCCWRLRLLCKKVCELPTVWPTVHTHHPAEDTVGQIGHVVGG